MIHEVRWRGGAVVYFTKNTHTKFSVQTFISDKDKVAVTSRV